MRKDILKKIIVGCFVIVPLLSSIISTVHLVDFFYLGNPSWISYTVAFAIEIGSVASFLTLSILSRLNKNIVWGMFLILFFMQVIGNVYFTYDWVTSRIAETPTWLTNFREMSEFFFGDVELKTSKMILALLIGVPIPLISVFLLKSTVDYLGTDSSEIDNEPDTTSPEPISEPEPIGEEKPDAVKNNEESQIDIQRHTERDSRRRLHPSRY
jgi:hypothetical protein